MDRIASHQIRLFRIPLQPGLECPQGNLPLVLVWTLHLTPMSTLCFIKLKEGDVQELSGWAGGDLSGESTGSKRRSRL